MDLQPADRGAIDLGAVRQQWFNQHVAEIAGNYGLPALPASAEVLIEAARRLNPPQLRSDKPVRTLFNKGWNSDEEEHELATAARTILRIARAKVGRLQRGGRERAEVYARIKPQDCDESASALFPHEEEMLRHYLEFEWLVQRHLSSFAPPARKASRPPEILGSGPIKC